MWYGIITKNHVYVFINNIKYTYNVSNCRYICIHNGIIYLLTDSYITAYKDHKCLFKKNTIEKYCEKIIVDDFIYISGNDSGTIYKYDHNGIILESIKIGEHISDFTIFNKNLYVLAYFNNKLTVLNNFNVVNEIYFSKYPHSIICDNEIYIVLLDEFYLYIYKYSLSLTLIKKIKTKNQIANFFSFEKSLIIDGTEQRMILNRNLNFQSIKKSTGINLCKFSNYPVLENKKYLDIYNNIIFP